MQQRQVDAGWCNVVVVAHSDSHHRGAYVICSWLISQLAAGLLVLSYAVLLGVSLQILFFCKSFAQSPVCSCPVCGHSSFARRGTLDHPAPRGLRQS